MLTDFKSKESDNPHQSHREMGSRFGGEGLKMEDMIPAT